MAPSKCSMRARIIFAIIGLLVGISIFFCFGIGYENWHTAVWGLLSGLIAGITLALHIWYKRDHTSPDFRTWAHNMRPLMLLGCFLQLGAICGIVAYLTIAVFEHQALTPYGRGYYLTAIWCFITWKWGFLLFLFARQYRRDFQSAPVVHLIYAEEYVD